MPPDTLNGVVLDYLAINAVDFLRHLSVTYIMNDEPANPVPNGYIPSHPKPFSTGTLRSLIDLDKIADRTSITTTTFVNDDEGEEEMELRDITRITSSTGLCPSERTSTTEASSGIDNQAYESDDTQTRKDDDDEDDDLMCGNAESASHGVTFDCVSLPDEDEDGGFKEE